MKMFLETHIDSNRTRSARELRSHARVPWSHSCQNIPADLYRPLFSRAAGFALAATLATAVLLVTTAHGAGLTAANFLTLGSGARIEAMAGAGTSLAYGVDATYWNAASLGRFKASGVSFSHAAWFADIDYEFVGYVQELEKGMSLALSSCVLHTGGIPRTFEDAYGLYQETDGAFSYTGMTISASLGREVALGFFAGTTAKFIYEDNAGEGASGIAFDICGLYSIPGNDVSLGIALRNIGPGLSDGNVTHRLPSQVAIGAAMALADSNLVLASDATSGADTGVRLSWGVEQRIRNVLFLRAGYTISTDRNARRGFTLGAGTCVRGFSVDYSVSDYQKLGLVHRFTVGLGGH
jgi:hypothetical protein